MRPLAGLAVLGMAALAIGALSFALGWNELGAGIMLLVLGAAAQGVYAGLTEAGIIAPGLLGRWFGFG